MIYIVQFGSGKTPQIKSCVTGCGVSAEISDWKTEHTRPQEVQGIILSGSPILLTESDPAPYLDLLKQLLDWKVPVLGICFGHQILGMFYGAKIYKGSAVRTQTTIHLKENDSLFSGFQNETEMAEDHTEGIHLPENFSLLGSSDSYLVEAMKHQEKALWGVQFHPEVSGENGMKLFRNFIQICNSF